MLYSVIYTKEKMGIKSEPGIKSYTGPAAWYGPQLAASDEWKYQLSGKDIDEIHVAMKHANERGIRTADVRSQDFPLPTLGPKLKQLQQDFLFGRGFVVVKGLPVESYTREEAVLAFWGLGTYLGEAVSQNAKGHLMGHVKDIGHDPNNPQHRVYATSARQPYHTDSADVVCLLCLKPAKTGGLSSIVSSTSIHNEMLKARPDLVAILSEPFYVGRKGEIPEGKKDYYKMAVFHHHADRLVTIFARGFIQSAQQYEEVPRLTEKQIEALDMMEALAAREDLLLYMELEPGDMQYLHNHQILHSRTAYVDYPEAGRKRHLLRLWLSQPEGWELPPVFSERYGDITLGTRRGGIKAPGTQETLPLEAE